MNVINYALFRIFEALIYSGRVRSQYLVDYDNARPGIGHRSTSANISTSNSGGMKRFLATSAMTTGKPGPDGHILHFDWNEADKNGAQLYLPGASGGDPAYRSQSTSADWSGVSWNTFLTDNNTADYVVEHGVSVFASDNTSWTYFKYASGVVDMWGYKSVASSTPYATQPFGNNIYAYNHYTDMAYPFVLMGQPLVIPSATVGNAFTIPTVLDSNIYTDRVRIYGQGIYVGQQTGTQQFVARCHLIGLWK